MMKLDAKKILISAKGAVHCALETLALRGRGLSIADNRGDSDVDVKPIIFEN